MENQKINLKFIYGERPFKGFKDGNYWIIEQQENFKLSKLKSEGGNNISM